MVCDWSIILNFILLLIIGFGLLILLLYLDSRKEACKWLKKLWEKTGFFGQSLPLILGSGFLILLLSLVGWLLYYIIKCLSYLDSNICFDLVLGFFTILALVLIAYIYHRKGKQRVTRGWHLVPVSLIIAVLFIFLGGVMYSPLMKAFPIKTLSFCDCEVSFVYSLNKEGKAFCEALHDCNSSFLQRPRSYLPCMNHGEIVKILGEIKCEEKLELCCSPNSEKLIKKICELKKNYLSEVCFNNFSMNARESIIKCFLLDELAIKTLQNTIVSCKCKECKCKEDNHCF